jgi:pilus assembly protein CpaC
MHRTNRVPRFLAWALLIAVLLPAAAPSARAQEKLPPPGFDPDATSRLETIGIAQTRKLQMTTKAALKAYEIDFPNVARFDKVDKDLTSVYVTGLAAGRAVITLTDVNNKTERVIIIVDDTEQRKAELLDLIRKIAPTAVVQVTVAKNSVILTGVVTDIDMAQRVMEAARGIFAPPSAIAIGGPQGGTPVSAVTIYNGMRIGGVQQVQLEVVVAVVNRSRLRQMDFSFIRNSSNYVLNSTLNSPLAFANSLATAAGSAATLQPNVNTPTNLSFGILGNRDSFTGFLGALNTEGLTKILADSRVSTLSGRPGQIASGGETPILTSTGVGPPSVSYKQFGTVVNYLPIVMGNGKIHLEIHSELSAINQANGITIPGVINTVVPGFDTRSATVAVQLEDGQTLAIGGLIQNTVNANIQRVPILGDLPVVGMAFTNKTYKETEEELLILVTPRLVDGIACTQIPKYLPGRITRSPDDFELFLEGIIEAPRGPRTVYGPREYQGAHMQSPNIGQIPCAGGVGGAGCGASGCATPLGISGQYTAAPTGPAPVLPSPASLTVEAPAAITPVPVPLPAAIIVPDRSSAMPPIRDVSQPAAPTLPSPMAPPQASQVRPGLPPPVFGPAIGDVR